MMSQPSISVYFQARKRGGSNQKVLRIKKSQQYLHGDDVDALNFSSDQRSRKSICKFSKGSRVLECFQAVSSNQVGSGAKKCERSSFKEAGMSLNRSESRRDPSKTSYSSDAKTCFLKRIKVEGLQETLKQMKQLAHRKKTGDDFLSVDLEVLTSPKKSFKTPSKLHENPIANEIEETSKNLQPETKNDTRLVASSGTYQNKTVASCDTFSMLDTTRENKLLIPTSYRRLFDIFKCLDTICLILFKRKEIITFKKLKPLLQRMLKKDFDESHLSQIKSLFPEAFRFSLSKMRNFGSTSKEDYYQLVITPNFRTVTSVEAKNIECREQMVSNKVIFDRQQRFYRILLNKVKDEHDKFLNKLNPPLIIPKEEIIRWHPDFNLESCAEIEKAHLPRTASLGNYSSANHILTAARNLFNSTNPSDTHVGESKKIICEVKNLRDNDCFERSAVSILKNVPKTLLHKIRAKQTMKALESVTECPGRNLKKTAKELPCVALHLRNIFVTEKKNVLPFNKVLEKIAFSYETALTALDLETYIYQIRQKFPNWINLLKIRHDTFVRLDRASDFKDITRGLECEI